MPDGSIMRDEEMIMARGQVGKKKIVIRKAGKKPIAFEKGALHRQLGVPEGEPIPPGKKAAALAGREGPLAKKRANFAFRGALAAGRSSAKRKRRKSRASRPRQQRGAFGRANPLAALERGYGAG